MTNWFISDPYGQPSFTPALYAWQRDNFRWAYCDSDAYSNPELGHYWLNGPRFAEAQEVAEELAQDPRVREVLAVIASPAGQAIEQAVLQLALPQAESKLLVDALTIAAKAIRDENRPLWRRADVLMSTAVAVVAIVGLALYLRHHRKPPAA